MRPSRLRVGGLMAALVLGVGGWQSHLGNPPPTQSKQSTSDGLSITGLGDVKTLQAKYARWKASLSQDADRKLVLMLRYSKGLSREVTRASGQVTFDLVDGRSSVQVFDLPEGGTYDVWLIDNRPGPESSLRPNSGDRMIRLGSLRPRRGSAKLEAVLIPERLAAFKLDLVVVVREGEDPGRAGLLFGSPDLFQRLYYNEQRVKAPTAGGFDPRQEVDTGRTSLWSASFRALVPAPAYAAAPAGGPVGVARPPALEDLISRGEFLFFNETFNGNGRTCGTCHRAENNFTIDPKFIATLPPNDPLFVAEFNPDLAGLENPVLMRNSGLIMENVDGFDKPAVLRGTPHLLGLMTSLVPDSTVGAAKADATGWSGDGAPGTGSLREFATGAVIQHFTRRLNRVEGIDFRPPTSDELDALEAFQLSLGRSADPPLPLQLTGKIARRGQAIFRCRKNTQPLTCSDLEFGTVPSGRCVACHENAGANTAGPGAATEASAPEGGVNGNFDTGVERSQGQPGRLLDPTIPCDAGFGTAPVGPGPCQGVGTGTGFGVGSFNTPPVIEAADTGPFFHNHSVKTLEGAISFYNGAAFNNSPGALSVGINGFANAIGLDEPDVDAVAAFLRVLNALENIRNSISMGTRALALLEVEPQANSASVDRLLSVARAEVGNAVQVLDTVDLHLDAVAKLQKAGKLLARAVGEEYEEPFGEKQKYMKRALKREREARRLICPSQPGTVLCEND